VLFSILNTLRIIVINRNNLRLLLNKYIDFVCVKSIQQTTNVLFFFVVRTGILEHDAKSSA
jgi:hypothetical protein